MEQENTHMKHSGLSSTQAEELLERYGKNTLGTKKREHPAVSFLRTFDSPLVIILLIVSLASFFLGERMNAIIIFGMVLIGSVVDFLNTYRSSRAAEKLILRVQTLVSVIRDGTEQEIPVQSVVPGDIALLSAGKLVPADGTVLEANDFFVNQSALTGESFPSEKRPSDPLEQGEKGLFERDDLVFMGTSVVTGFATIRVEKTGNRTEYGEIADHLSRDVHETDFERGIRDFSLFIMRINILLVSLVLLINMLIGRNFLDSIAFAVAIAIGLTPELLPVMLSVSLARGSTRMARKHAIVKSLSAIQNFGNMNILCTDKTGTLTEDRISLVRHIDSNGNDSEEVFLYSYLNSSYQTGVKNPIDQAIQEHGHPDISSFEKIDEIPFDFERRRDSLVIGKNGKRLLVTKGAPENIIPISSFFRDGTHDLPIRQEKRDALQETYRKISDDGFRVLAIAIRALDDDDYIYDKADESEMVFLGFIAFLDPPKKDAFRTMHDLAELGISVKILTGDSDILTRKVCRDIGIPVDGVVLGKDLENLSEKEISEMASKSTIFARMTPSQKERVISALRKVPGNVVGYMGDGINDAIALKAADVGISVQNAVPVAKDAAAIILLEKNFSVLRDGIEEGRKTFQNTMKYIMMWLSSNFGNMFSMMGASAFLPFLPMAPQQILLNNFLYDAAQVGLPTDNVDQEAVKRPPRWDLRKVRWFMVIFGTASSIFDMATFAILFLVFHLSEGAFQTGWFLESIATQILVIHFIRSKKFPFLQSRPSRFLLLNTLGILFLGWVIALSPFGEIFSFGKIPIHVVGTIIGITCSYLLLIELLKRIFRKVSVIS